MEIGKQSEWQNDETTETKMEGREEASGKNEARMEKK